MTFYLNQGKSFRPTPDSALQVHERLPAGNFIVKKDPMSGEFFFDRVDSFVAPTRIYGDLEAKCERIFRTFEDRPASTGCLLSGEKGSGKTLLAKLIAIEGEVRGLPTVLVNEALHGEMFDQLIQSINQPAIILFDEFEKVYDFSTQNHLLTLLDGVYPSKKLFVLTCNDHYRVDSHMRNRPGRIYYFMRFDSLPQVFVEQYCRERLLDKQHTASILKVGSIVENFSFDALQALVEEMNRFRISPAEALELLNVKPSEEAGTQYLLKIFKPGGEAMLPEHFHPNNLNQMPLSMNRLGVSIYGHDADGDLIEKERITFGPHELMTMDGEKGYYTYRNKAGYRLEITRDRAQHFSFNDYLAV